MKTLSIDSIKDKVIKGERIYPEEALYLWENVDFVTLGNLADFVRKKFHPEDIVTFVVDRNVNYTNVCIAGCKFCAFYRKKSDNDAYLLDIQTILDKVRELVEWGGTTLLMQGGINPD
ncbi:MAG TPA: dehypoxanthine futalosine cyclase, partial [Aquifex aeolicus]|nr:dehypoxanthine futalosine cyclase [Aquifex aeolicus]